MLRQEIHGRNGRRNGYSKFRCGGHQYQGDASLHQEMAFKSWPVAASLKFFFGAKKQLITLVANIGTLLEIMVIFPLKRSFGTLMKGDVLFFWAEWGVKQRTSAYYMT